MILTASHSEPGVTNQDVGRRRLLLTANGRLSVILCGRRRVGRKSFIAGFISHSDFARQVVGNGASSVAPVTFSSGY
jgi:hypothetical protein